MVQDQGQIRPERLVIPKGEGMDQSIWKVWENETAAGLTFNIFNFFKF